MENFNYVGNSLFHVADNSIVQDQESIYLYLKNIKNSNFIEDDLETLLTKINFSMMTYPEKVSYISNVIMGMLTGNTTQEDLIRNMCDALVVQSYSVFPVSWDSTVYKLKAIPKDTTLIEKLIAQSTKEIPIGASDYTIRDISNEILQSNGNIQVISDLKDGAEVSIYTTEASKILMDLVDKLRAGNNWSTDYILMLISQMAEEALLKLNMASQLSLNSRNSYRYSGISGNISDSNSFNNIAVINATTNLILDEIYTASDAKVPNRLDLSALLSDILHSSNSLVFAFNQYKNLDELLNALEHVTGCETILSRVEYQLDNTTVITEDLLLMIEEMLLKCPTNKIPDQMSKNISALSKTSNKVPNSEVNLGSILALVTASKTLISNKLEDFFGRFFGEGKDIVNRLNSIIDKLTSKLSTVIGPVLSKVIEVISKITVAVVAINAILCSFKAAMCAIGSLISTMSNAIDTINSYTEKFQSYTSNLLKNANAMSDVTDIFSSDLASDISSHIRDGLSSLSNEFQNALSSIVSGELLDKAMEAFSGECQICSVVNNAFDIIKSHVDELVSSAMESVTNSISEGMKCPAIKLPSTDGISLPKLPDDFNIELPSLSLKVGC